VRAAVALRNVIREAQHVLVVAIVPPQCDLDADAVLVGLDHDRLRQHRGLRTVEVSHERGRAALVDEFLALDVGMTCIRQHDLGAGVQECEFAQAMFQRRIIELDDVVECLGRRKEGHFRAALALAVADDLERSHWNAIVKLDEMFLAFAPDAALEPGRERVDDRHADAVQTA